jgi:predicted O-methyltransferase YrrM
VGINLNQDGQLQLLSLFEKRFKTEYDSLPLEGDKLPAYSYFINNGSFESVDGEVLYCVIRYFKPRRVLEIGSGYSTRLMAEAIAKNSSNDASYNCEITSIDPFQATEIGHVQNVTVVPKRVQDVPLSEFMRLGENDILFIDSSHCVAIGSDTQYEYLEILPRLRHGVLVHVHDIFMPSDYPQDWILKQHRFWNEQYLLQAFLEFNHDFEILWMASYMHLTYPERLEGSFASYRRNMRWPGSLWMKRN